MDDKVIIIHLSIFLNRYNNIKVSDNIINKAEQLRKTCSCFNSLYDPKMIWEEKLFNKKDKNTSGYESSTNVNNKGRVHIIIPDFSDSSNIKRTLIGYLNKLTQKNKDLIYEKIKVIIYKNNTDEVFLIIWSYIKVSDCDNNIYIKLLEYFGYEFLNSSINKLRDSYLNND